MLIMPVDISCHVLCKSHILRATHGYNAGNRTDRHTVMKHNCGGAVRTKTGKKGGGAWCGSDKCESERCAFGDIRHHPWFLHTHLVPDWCGGDGI